MILNYSITIFITQLIFIGCRTWNVKAIAKNDLIQVLLSGTFVHLSWLVSIAIGSMSMIEIINNFQFAYLPIILCSLSGGLIGSYLGLKERKSKKKENNPCEIVHSTDFNGKCFDCGEQIFKIDPENTK